MPIPLAQGSQMHGALVPIGYTTVTNSTTSILTFSSIPQVYQDLRMVVSVRGSNNATTDLLGFYTQASGTIYSTTHLVGNGSAVSSSREQNLYSAIRPYIAGATATSGIFSSVTIDILNYANTSTYKTFLSRTATDLNGSGNTELTVSLMSSTSAVTTVTIQPQLGSYLASGSTFTLYGIRSVGQ